MVQWDCGLPIAKLPVVIVSGTAERSTAFNAGAARVIGKPFDVDTLLAVVESVRMGSDAPSGLSVQRSTPSFHFDHAPA